MPELTIRDAMVLLGSLLILAVIVDAWRRIRQQKRDRVRLKLATDLPDEDDVVDDLAMFRELPNGGARIVSRDDLLGRRGSANAVAPAASADMQSTDAAETEAPDAGTAKQSVAEDSGSVSVPSVEAASAVSDSSDLDAEHLGEIDEPLSGVRASNDEPTNLDWLEDLGEGAPAEPEARELSHDSETDVIILHVLSRDERGFAGKQILELLLACDLRFGDMSFFHRHEQQAGRGPIQFSVANMLQPGVFDIDNMEAMQTRGLVFFLALPGPEDMSQAFDYMLETARAVARNLGGELLDESRSVLTQQAVEQYRQQIRELERRLLTQGA